MISKESQAGTKADSEPKPIDTTSSQTIGNTFVVGSQSHGVERDMNICNGIDKVKNEIVLNSLFDKKFGYLNGCAILSHDEYNKLKDFSIKTGLFYFQILKYGWFC